MFGKPRDDPEMASPEPDQLLGSPLSEDGEAPEGSSILGKHSWSSTLLLAFSLGVAFFTFYLLSSLYIRVSLEREGRISGNPCLNPSIRREWRSLSVAERKDFLGALHCLARSPSRLGLNGTRYDDFVYTHYAQYENSHNVAAFFPWHRYFISIFERAIREECGYQGYLTYWDWALDSDEPEMSPIWSKEIGLGGSYDPETNCVVDGQFAYLRPIYPNRHCFQRKFMPGMYSYNYTPEVMHGILSDSRSFHEFRVALESTPHKSVHNGIGGEMPTAGSPNDPVFWVHHTQIDRLWWVWQQQDPDRRKMDYSGNRDMRVATHRNGSWIHPATIDDPLLMMNMDEDITVLDIVSTESTRLCYLYQ